MATNSFIYKHYEKVILAGLLLLFSGLLYLQLAVVKDSQAKKVDGIVNAPEPPADFKQTNYYKEKKYSKEVLFDKDSLVWNELLKKDNPHLADEETASVDMMVPVKMSLCKHDNHLTPSSSYPKKGSKDKKDCLICGKELEAPLSDVALVLKDDPVNNDINRNGIDDNWEREHSFEVVEVPEGTEIIIEDTDGDGFDNKEEFEAKTGPRDPLSHPLFVTKLVFDSEKPVTDIKFEEFVNDKLSKVKDIGAVTDFKLEECRGTPKDGARFSYRNAKGVKRTTPKVTLNKNNGEILYKTKSSADGDRLPTIGFRVVSIDAENVKINNKDVRRGWVKIVSTEDPKLIFECHRGETIVTGYKRVHLVSQVDQKKFSTDVNTKAVSSAGNAGAVIELGNDTAGIEKYQVVGFSETDQGITLELKGDKGIYKIKSQAPAEDTKDGQESAK